MRIFRFLGKGKDEFVGIDQLTMNNIELMNRWSWWRKQIFYRQSLKTSRYYSNIRKTNLRRIWWHLLRGRDSTHSGSSRFVSFVSWRVVYFNAGGVHCSAENCLDYPWSIFWLYSGPPRSQWYNRRACTRRKLGKKTGFWVPRLLLGWENKICRQNIYQWVIAVCENLMLLVLHQLSVLDSISINSSELREIMGYEWN